MKRVLSIACLLFCFALTVSVSAQATPQGAPPTAGMKIATDADYATHMKEIGQLNGVLNKSIKGGDGRRSDEGGCPAGSAVQEHSQLTGPTRRSRTRRPRRRRR